MWLKLTFHVHLRLLKTREVCVRFENGQIADTFLHVLYSYCIIYFQGPNSRMCLKLTFRVHMRLVKTREVCTEDGLIEGALIVWLPHEFDSAHLNNP